MRKRVERNILPNVHGTRFIFDNDVMYWVDDEGIKHEVLNAAICANGVRDLCIYWKGPNSSDVSVGKIAEVPKEHIVYIPRGDILWISFEPPYGNMNSVYIPIEDSTMKDIVKEMIRRGEHGKKGPDYEMYGGQNYWD